MKYRDSKTGRFVSSATWKRSKSRGGRRYKRERVTKTRKKRTPTPPPPPPVLQIYEWLVTFAPSAGKRSRSLDVIVTAQEEEQAVQKAVNFASRNRKAKRAIESDALQIKAIRGKAVGYHNPTQWRADTMEDEDEEEEDEDEEE